MLPQKVYEFLFLFKKCGTEWVLSSLVLTSEQATIGKVIAITTSLPRDDSMEDDLELLVSVDITK